MRFLSLLLVVALVTSTLPGCSPDESANSDTLAPPSATQPVTSQSNSNSVFLPMEKLIEAGDDERDSDGHLIAISLYEKDVTLSELAELEEAGSIRRLNAGHSELTDADMVFLSELTGLEKLEFNVNQGITDAGLQHLRGLHKLRFLSLFFCPQLTGAGFAHLEELDNLVILNIGNNKSITDDNLKYLQELESLQVLNAAPLWGITDEGLKHLSQINDLRRLRFTSKQITDQGLEHLVALKNLEILQLQGCSKLTDAGIAKLQQALSDCRIVR